MQQHLGPGGELASRNSAGVKYSSGGIQDRTVAVVTQLFVPLDDVLPQRSRTAALASFMSTSTLSGGRYSNRCEVRSKNSGRKYSMPPGATPALTSR